MDDQALMQKLDELKLKVDLYSKERDELKQQLYDAIGYRPPHCSTPTTAETIRENIIDIWKDIERSERRYRVDAIGLESKRRVYADQLYFFETR